jgi:hypothetical protein
MVFAKASSFSEHEEHGFEYWRHATPESKFQAIVELVEAGCYLSGANVARAGFDRSAHGVAKLGS